MLTDNRNRAVAELKHVLNKNGGNMGENGCVSWLFDKRGLVIVEKDSIDEDELFMAAAEAGAEDVTSSEDSIEILTPFEDFDRVRTIVEETGAQIQVSEMTMIPQNTVKLEGKEAERMIRLMGAIEELDDVQKVYANFDIPDEILEAAA